MHKVYQSDVYLLVTWCAGWQSSATYICNTTEYTVLVGWLLHYHSTTLNAM